MASKMGIEFIIGAVIGWYISSQFLAGPVSSIVSQITGRLSGGGGGSGHAQAHAKSSGY